MKMLKKASNVAIETIQAYECQCHQCGCVCVCECGLLWFVDNAIKSSADGEGYQDAYDISMYAANIVK